VTEADRRPEPPAQGPEHETLVGFLTWLRLTIERKTDGLDREQLNRTHPPSMITLGGLLRHLAYVEDYWVGHILVGAEPEPPWSDAPWSDDGDWDWHSAVDDEPDELRELWRATVQRSDRLLSGLEVDRPSALPRGQVGHVSVRWVLIHLIEEYARHAGHADLIREAIDGTVGE